MIENPSARKGLIAEKRAELHFITKGYNVCWPAMDNGFDLLLVNGEQAARVQVKTLPVEGGAVRLDGAGSAASKRDPEARKQSAKSAAASPRHYDLLVVVGDQHIWTIPEAATRGIYNLNPGYTKSKWTKFREERLDGRSPQD